MANYILNDEAYNQHYFAVLENDIIVLMENGKSLAWILRIDKKTVRKKTLSKSILLVTFYNVKH